MIYGIVDPEDDSVFYVGHTSRFDLRRKQHLQGGDTLSGLRIRQIKRRGATPLFIQLEICGTRQAAQLGEIFWMETFRCRGTALTNAQAFTGYEARAKARKSAAKGTGFEARLDYLERLANGRPAREGKTWSKKEEAMVRRLKREGRSVHEIADVVERSVAAIEMRLRTPR